MTTYNLKRQPTEISVEAQVLWPSPLRMLTAFASIPLFVFPRPVLCLGLPRVRPGRHM